MLNGKLFKAYNRSQDYLNLQIIDAAHITTALVHSSGLGETQRDSLENIYFPFLEVELKPAKKSTGQMKENGTHIMKLHETFLQNSVGF